MAHLQSISIHSPRMGRDAFTRSQNLAYSDFNPLSPHGERQVPGRRCSKGTYFNPLSPHGERHNSLTVAFALAPFQSTLPAWGETIYAGNIASAACISIHSPRMGRDPMDALGKPVGGGISIHSPRMGRDFPLVDAAVFAHISIHSPRMGRDTTSTRCAAPSANFNPLSPHGERRGVTG